MTLGSLFDGIGGFPLAAVRHGITPVWASEIEPFCVAVTRRRFPGMAHLGDITKIDGGKIPPVDIITWGSPCQDLSIAGRRAGLAGERSGLYVQAVRIVRGMLAATNREFPKFCVFENVPGLLSSNKGEDFMACMDMMQNLGFLPDPNILDAQDMGVPQRRKRVFIVWVNVDYILSRKTDTLRSITLQLHTEILQTILAGLLRASGEGRKKSVVNDARFAEDGLMKRIKLFSLQEESRLQMLQSVLAETQATYGTEQKSSDGNHGGDQTADTTSTVMDTKFITSRTGRQFGCTEWSLRKELDEALNLAKSSTISTLTKEIIVQKTYFYFKALLNTLDAITHLMQSQKEMDATLNQQYEWVLHTLIWLEEYINAKRKYDKSVGEMGWDVYLRLCKSAISDCTKLLVGSFGSRRAEKILFKPDGLPGNTPQGRATGKGTAGDFAGSAGGCHCYDTRGNGGGDVLPTITGDHAGRTNDYMPLVLLNDQGGDSISVEKNNISPTLRPQSHGNQPVIAYTAGFSHKNSAKASIGFKTETAPTLRVGQVSAAVYAIGNGQGNQTGLSDVARTLNCMHDQQAVMFRSPCYGVDCRNMTVNEELYPTLQAKNTGGTSLNFYGAAMLPENTKYIVRRFTPLECERLQGFPDGWTDIGPWTDDSGKAHKESADTARYRALGNSLAIPCAERIIEGIADYAMQRRSLCEMSG